jgi:Ca-activated chloride channel family protein
MIIKRITPVLGCLVCTLLIAVMLATSGCTVDSYFNPSTASTESTGAGNWERSRSSASRLESGQSGTPFLGDIPIVGQAFGPQSQAGAGDILTTVLPEDEVWIITKPRMAPANVTNDTPGAGAMLCVPAGVDPDDVEQHVPMPLKHTDVNARIDGYVASVTITQEFANPYDTKIEAVYVFPLPQNAAVSHFLMVIGDRRIRGIIREREEAEKIYHEARAQGFTASLMTQERPNIFTQKVANIEPGRAVDVEVTYFNTLSYTDGWRRFVFPMVVGPRFNPPDSTDGVGAVGRGRSGASGQSTEVTYLKPNERSGHDIALDLTINAGSPIEELACTTHHIEHSPLGDAEVRVSLADEAVIPNKDFVLAYRVAGEQVRGGFIAQQSDQGGYFTFMLYPPADLSEMKRAPIEMVFVIDCSGSMSGEPLRQAKRAMTHAIKQLEPDDTFQIIRFSNDATTFGDRPVMASAGNIKDGLRFVKKLSADGGTMMNRAVEEALDAPNDNERLRYVMFLTDGYIGNEQEILDTIRDRISNARIFSFGIGSSVNRYLMQRMAKIGRGAAAYITPGDDPDDIVDLFIERISHPAMTDVIIDWGGLDVTDVYPKHTPDLFVGRPVTVTGRFMDSAPTTITVTGKQGGRPVTYTQRVDPRDNPAGEALAKVWARMRIAELSDAQGVAVEEEVRGTALEYGLLSAYTAFIAVDSSRRTEGAHGVTVPVAVPVPEGVRYDTTVDDG